MSMSNTNEDEDTVFQNLPANATLHLNNKNSTSNIPSLINVASKVRIPLKPESARVTKSTRCLVLGRQVATCDVQLKHSSISRRHAVVYFKDNVLYVQDIGGKKGTFVNGERVPGGGVLSVKHGDVITFGNAVDELTFRADIQQLEKQQLNTESDYTNSHVMYESTGLNSSREQREAEIAAITASLDEVPTWSKNHTSEIEVSSNNDKMTTSKEKNVIDGIQKDSLDTTRKHAIDIPISHVANLRTGMEATTTGTSERKTKAAISALSVDPSGSRVLAGTSSGSVIFWGKRYCK